MLAALLGQFVNPVQDKKQSTATNNLKTMAKKSSNVERGQAETNR